MGELPVCEPLTHQFGIENFSDLFLFDLNFRELIL